MQQTSGECLCATCSHMLKIVRVVWARRSTHTHNIACTQMHTVEAAHIQPSFSGQKERKKSALFSQKHNRCTQICAVTFYCSNETRFDMPSHGSFQYMCSICLASLRLDSARAEPESRKPTRFTSFSLSPILCSLKSLQRETCWKKREKRDKWEWWGNNSKIPVL